MKRHAIIFGSSVLVAAVLYSSIWAATVVGVKMIEHGVIEAPDNYHTYKGKI